MKICLILSPSWGIETPHLGIALLTAALRRQNHPVSVCDFNIQFHDRYKEKGLWKSEEDVHWEDEESILKFIKENDLFLEAFVDKVLSENAKIIGFSIYNTTQRLSLELAKRIKDKDKNKIIIFGGQQCFPKESAAWLLKDESVDVVVNGEGDEILPELVGKIEKLRRVDFCPGIMYKKNGKIIDCGIRPPISNLDYLPFPDFSDFSLQSYGNPHQLPILSSRGCPFQCVFCSTKLFWSKYRSMSGERVFKEIEYQLKKYPEVSFFTFNDHVVNANMDVLAKFCNLILEAKLNNKISNLNWEKLNWRGAAVIREEMDKPFLKKMKESGCVEIEYGIESAAPKVREKMRKFPFSTEVVEQVIRDTYAAGINVRANFMFGFPGETEEDLGKTLDFLKRNKAVFTQVHPSETFCHIDPGTYLINHLEEFDVSLPSFHSLYWESSDGKNLYPERLRRHQLFCESAAALNIPLSPGGHKIMLHKEIFLSNFSHYKDSIANKKKNASLAGGDIIKSAYRHHWNWDIHYACNYKCTYCYYTKNWDECGKRNRYIGIAKWIEIWDRIFSRYGSCHIHISGGEPFIYPNFIELITVLSKKHSLEVSTNLSFSPGELLNEIDPKRLKIDGSLHPECADYETVLEKVSLLKKGGFDISVTYVGWPPLLERMQEYKKGFDALSTPFIISPFRGEFEGKAYPESYTKAEIELLRRAGGDSLTNKDSLNFQLKDKKTEKRICHMGHLYGKIYPDGIVCRCCYRRDIGILGNLIDQEDFKLLEQPEPCPVEKEKCCCWRAMIVGKEDDWLAHWNVKF